MPEQGAPARPANAAGLPEEETTLQKFMGIAKVCVLCLLIVETMFILITALLLLPTIANPPGMGGYADRFAFRCMVCITSGTYRFYQLQDSLAPVQSQQSLLSHQLSSEMHHQTPLQALLLLSLRKHFPRGPLESLFRCMSTYLLRITLTPSQRRKKTTYRTLSGRTSLLETGTSPERLSST